MVQTFFQSSFFFLTQHNVSKLYPCSSVYLSTFPFAACTVRHSKLPFPVFLAVRSWVAPPCRKKQCRDKHLYTRVFTELSTDVSRAVSGVELIGHGEYACWISLIASRLFSSITVPLYVPTGVKTRFLPLCTQHCRLLFNFINFIILLLSYYV